MDRIRKALDLAREEREALDGGGGARTFEAKVVARIPTTISYTRTTLFTPDVAVLESNRIVGAASTDPAAAAFRMLRTQVLQRMKENNWRSIAVFSPGSEDGKTTTAINLAISIANDHRHTVLLVDYDLKRPTIAEKFGLTPELGADDVLHGDARVEQCLYHPEGFDRLVLLPARAPMAHSSEALASLRSREIVGELLERYSDRILVFDLPPILGADDALAFAPLVGCGLMVVAEGSTQRQDLLRSMELLRNTPMIGTVLNQATDVASAYG
jgi:Mrp family chromosome partitioning ATPase